MHLALAAVQLPAKLDSAVQRLKPERPEQGLPHGLDQWLDRLYLIGLMVAVGVVAWWLVRFLRAHIERLAARAAARHGEGVVVQEQRARTVSQLLANAAHTVIAIIVVLGILRALGLDIAPLIASAGVIGLAISFGSQNLVKDYVTGFFLQLEHQFDIGDLVKIGAFTGTVEDITLRLVYLRDADGTLHIIPNGSITQLSNFSRSWARASVDVDVKWDAVDRATVALTRAGHELAADPEWRHAFQQPPEVEGIEKLTSDTVTLRLTARVDPRRRDEVERAMRRRALEALEQLREASAESREPSAESA